MVVGNTIYSITKNKKSMETLSVTMANLQYQRECDFNNILQMLNNAKEETMYYIKKYVNFFGKKNEGARVYNLNEKESVELFNDSLCLIKDKTKFITFDNLSLNEVIEIARQIQ